VTKDPGEQQIEVAEQELIEGKLSTCFRKLVELCKGLVVLPGLAS
jgi:hypothetical protein